jgi:lipopolysaccharide transport system permease protein
MKIHSIHPSEMFASLWRHRELVWALTKRDVLGRYRGSVFGILWSFFNPVLMLAVYTFVFSVIFKARWSAQSESRTEFALVLFAGLMVFGLFSECISRAPGLILSNLNYVKKVVFPLEVLPWISLGAALFHFMISLLVWTVAYLVLFGMPHASMLYLPLVLVPFLFFVMGLSWLLASLGVYLRDVSQFVTVLISVLMFLSPIFYPLSILPPEYRDLVALSPIASAVEMARDVLYWGKAPNWLAWLGATSGSAVMAWLGFSWFQKTRKGFADVV